MRGRNTKSGGIWMSRGVRWERRPRRLMKRGYGDARRIELMLVGLQEEVFMDRDDRSVVPVMGEKKEKKDVRRK
jgi:hypothetical protein